MRTFFERNSLGRLKINIKNNIYTRGMGCADTTTLDLLEPNTRPL